MPRLIKPLKKMKNEVIIITDDDEFKVVQIAGLIARRILCYCKIGDPVITGINTALLGLVQGSIFLCPIIFMLLFHRR